MRRRTGTSSSSRLVAAKVALLTPTTPLARLEWHQALPLTEDSHRPARLLTPVPDVWRLRPVLSFLRRHERAAHGLARWLDLTPAQQAAFERLVAEDAAFVRTSGEGQAPSDPAAVNTRMTALLARQDAALRRLLGPQYPGFRAWVRANWASQ